MSINLLNLNCCGIKEINGITYTRDVTRILDELRAQMMLTTRSCAFFIFSDNYRSSPYGDALASYIQAEGLGTVRTSNQKINPNSNNYVKVYVWEINQEAWRNFMSGVKTLKKSPPLVRLFEWINRSDSKLLTHTNN